MKKDRFLWSAHRITERQKAGKARSIKGKQLKNSRNTVSKQLVELLSSQRDNHLEQKKTYKTPETACFWGFSLPIDFSRTSRYVVGIFVKYFCTLDNHIIEIISFLAIPRKNLWYNMEKYY